MRESNRWGTKPVPASGGCTLPVPIGAGEEEAEEEEEEEEGGGGGGGGGGEGGSSDSPESDTGALL